jgi:putative hemolysin
LIALLATPLVYVLERSAHLLLRLMRVAEAGDSTVTEEEVKAVIEEGVAAGVLKPAEQAMIAGVMRVADWRVAAIMTPRPNIEWIDPKDSIEEIRRKFQITAYSRLPVARGDLEEILGVVQEKTC